MNAKATLALSLLALMAGCANRPESIRASFVSFERYTGQNCAQLTNTMAASRSELDKFSKMQDSKANGDAFGVFLLGVPFSKLSGDHEGDVARLKGEIEAIETAQIKGGCTAVAGSQPLATPTVIPVVAQQAPAVLKAPLVAQGIDTPQAEAFGKAESCSPAPTPALVAKGPGYETFSMACTNGDTLMVRCEFGNCRALR